MKYLLFIVLLVAVLMAAGCVSEDKSTAVTPTQTTSPLSTNTLTITPQTTAVSTPSQTYKTADLILTLNTKPTYGFKMDYPSEWTYKKARSYALGSGRGYNFSSPDEKSCVYVYIEDLTGAGAYWYPLDEITQNSMDKTSWVNNVIKYMTEKYCLDGAGNPGECTSSASGSSYYHRRLISNENVILSGNVKARKLVFAPDARDTSEWTTVYLMHFGEIQGYNFTVPGHTEVAVKVDGPVWDYGMGGQSYAIWLNTPNDQVKVSADILDHMIKSFEATVKY